MQPHTLSGSFTEWVELQHASGVYSPATVKAYTAAMRSFVGCVGDLQPDKVTREHAQRWQRTFGRLASSSINQRLSALHAYYADRVDDGHQDANPFAGLHRPKHQPKTVRRAASPEAVAVLLERAEPRARTMIALAVFLGLRRMEIAKLRLPDIDPDARTLSVVGKGGRADTLPIPAPAAHAINLWVDHAGVEPGGWLFPSTHGGHLSPDRVGEIMTAASVVEGHRITPHQYRHRAGTDVASSSNVKLAQRFLRHRSLATTSGYLDLGVEDLREALNTMHASG